MRGPIALAKKAKDILQTEGIAVLIKQSFFFLIRIEYETLLLYENTLEERIETDFMPKIRNFTFKIISSNKQAEELTNSGIELPENFTLATARLKQGAIAFCFVINGELAHIGWVAMTQKAKDSVDPYPYHVDFNNSEACTGGTVTPPKYRGLGFMTYGYYKRFQFLKERGIEVARSAVFTGNIASRKVHEKFRCRIYAKAQYLRILGWRWWREKIPEVVPKLEN